jgi:lipopolysaccharide export system permease protein
MMMIVVGVVREAAQQQLPAAQIFRLLPFVLPDALRVAVPVTLLLATTSVYGRMAGANEVVAAKSLGISPMTLLWPTLVVASVLSFATVYLNDLAVSWGRDGARKVVIEAVEEIVYGTLKAQKGYSTQRFAIAVRRVEGRRLIGPNVTIGGHDGSPSMTIDAEEAEIHADLANGVLKITLRNGTIDIEGKARFHFDYWPSEIPLQEASRTNNSPKKVPSWLSLSEIPDEELKQREVIRRHEQESAALGAYQMLSGDFDALLNENWNERQRNLAGEYNHLHRLMTEPHRRWSAGFSCLCFAWVGAPMAIRLRNRDFLTSFFLCFLPILVVYYPLLAYGVEGAKNGSVPPFAVWFGNVLLAGWGAWLLARVLRY